MRGALFTQRPSWFRGLAIVLLAIVFELSTLQSFYASLSLHIGTRLLGAHVLTAWRTEALPYVIATASASGLAWLLPQWKSRRFQVAFAGVLGLGTSVLLAVLPVSYSMDLYRYLWDGRLLTHGVSPYAYVPLDVHLTAFRDWPYWRNLAWKQWPEAYPPVAQAYFWLAAIVTNGSSRAFKLLLVLNGIVSAVLFLRVLRIRRASETASRQTGLSVRDVSVFTLFVLFPPMLIESFGAGHVDAFAIPWLLWAWIAGIRRQPVRLGIAIALATALKLYPVVLFAAFWRRGDIRFALQSLLSLLITVVIILIPILGNLHGFLAYYTQVSQMDYNGSLEFVLKRIFGSAVDTHSMWLVFGVEVVMWGFVLFTRMRELTIEQKASMLGLTFILASPLLHPWYLLPLLPFAAVGLDWATLWLAFSSHLTYDEVLWDMYIEYLPTYTLFITRMMTPWRKKNA